MIGLGIYTAGNKADAYRSSAVLSAADLEPLLDDLQDALAYDILAWENPAQPRRVGSTRRSEPTSSCGS